jgi:hypothetical protein
MKEGSSFPSQTKIKNILEFHGILTKKNEEHLIDMAIQMGL